MRSRKNVAQPGTDEAAQVRRLAVQALKRIDRGMASPELQEALVLGKHLRAGQAEAAVLIHGVLLSVIRAELTEIAQVEEVYADLVNALYVYLEDGEGYVWRDGRWHLMPAPVLAATG